MSSLKATPRIANAIKGTIYFVRLFARLGQATGEDAAVEKLYSKNGQYLYVANPKVATRSIADYFEEFDGCHIQVNHQTLVQFMQKNTELKGFYQFTFVRNPWARVYSCWVDKITNQGRFCDISIISRYKGVYPDMPFEEFIIWLSSTEGQDKFADRHWLSQHELLGGDRHAADFDFIGKLENIEDDFAVVTSHINIGSKKLPLLNSNNNLPLIYRQHYTEFTKALVAKRYAKDIARFEYQY
jgi:hypothetical protein